MYGSDELAIAWGVLRMLLIWLVPVVLFVLLLFSLRDTSSGKPDPDALDRSPAGRWIGHGEGFPHGDQR